METIGIRIKLVLVDLVPHDCTRTLGMRRDTILGMMASIRIGLLEPAQDWAYLPESLNHLHLQGGASESDYDDSDISIE
jgi:hypothetical protein